MKKLNLSILLCISFIIANAQDAFFISPSIGIVKKAPVYIFDAGVRWQKNEISFEAARYDPNKCGCCIKYYDRLPPVIQNRINKTLPKVWVANLRYSRPIPLKKWLYFIPTATLGTQMPDDKNNLMFLATIGIGGRLNITKNISFQLTSSAPLLENQKSNFKFPGVLSAAGVYYYILK